MVSAQKVTVVVPTYNERENLPELAERLFRLPVPGLTMLVVDDNSPDGTGLLAEELGRQRPGRIDVLHRPGKQGLATAYLRGFQRALEGGAEAVVQIDCDLSHRPEEIPAMLEKLRDADVVVGSRYVRGGGADPSWGLRRRMLSRSGNVYARVVLGLRPRDVLSGFKAYRREALERLGLGELWCKGFAFQAEIAHRCKRAGLRVTEHPIVFTERSRGASKMSKAIIVEALVKLPQLRWKGSAPSAGSGRRLRPSPRRSVAEEKEPGGRGKSPKLR